MLTTIIAMYYYMNIEKSEDIPLRSIPGLDAIPEAVGRCAEMGRPLHYTPGYTLGGLYNPTMGPGVLAGLTILRKVAEECATRGVPIIVTLAQPEAVPIAEENLRLAYGSQGETVPPNAVRFISTEQYAYAAGILGIMLEERPAANILMGYFWSESLQFAEGGSYIGAMQIGGTSSASQVPFFVASCDYSVIGEELFAAKAYVERDPEDLGSLRAQDILRAILITLAIILFIAGNIGLTSIVNFLGI
jgi:hypothetical protein